MLCCCSFVVWAPVKMGSPYEHTILWTVRWEWKKWRQIRQKRHRTNSVHEKFHEGQPGLACIRKPQVLPDVPVVHFTQSRSTTKRGVIGKNGKQKGVIFAHLSNEGIHFELSLQAAVQEKSSHFCQRLNQPYVEEQQFHRYGVENTSHYGLIFLHCNYPEKQITGEWPSLALCSPAHPHAKHTLNSEVSNFHWNLSPNLIIISELYIHSTSVLYQK